MCSSDLGRAVHYLRFSQNSDGGFGPSRHLSSTQLHTGWTALGLASANRNPRDVAQRGHSIIDYVDAHSSNMNDVGELERTLLVLSAAGLPPKLGNRNLLAALIAKQKSSGAFDTINHTAFGILALRAGGRSTRSREVRAATRWLLRVQNSDGGFGFAKSAASDVDDTGAVLQAIAAGGRRSSPVVGRAVRYLSKAQRPDGGFGQMTASESNAQSTAFAIQGLVAAGRNPRKFRRTRTPIAYLKSLQVADGSVRYSRTSAQTPVWVTAQALTGLEAKPYPLPPAPRQKARSVKAAAAVRLPVTKAMPAAKPRAKKSAAKKKLVARKRIQAADTETTETSIQTRPVAQTTSTTAPGPKQDDGEGDWWPFAFAVVIGIAILAGIRLAWRRE